MFLLFPSLAFRGNTDTRFARRALRESDGLNTSATQGSPLGIGQPWAVFFDTFGVVRTGASRLENSALSRIMEITCRR